VDDELAEDERRAREAQNSPAWPQARVWEPLAGDAGGEVDWSAADDILVPQEHLAVLNTVEQLPGDMQLQSRVVTCFTEVYEEVVRAVEAGDRRAEERALKMKGIMCEMLLAERSQRGQRGGRQRNRKKKAADMGSVEFRVQLWEAGEQRQLMHMWRVERARNLRKLLKKAGRPRAEVVGSKWDVEEMARKLEDEKVGDVLKMLTSDGVLDCSDPRVQQQLKAKHPQRGTLPGKHCGATMPTPEEFGVKSQPSRGEFGFFEFCWKETAKAWGMTKRGKAKDAGGGLMEYKMPYAWALAQVMEEEGEGVAEQVEAEGAEALRVPKRVQEEMERGVKAYTAYGELLVSGRFARWYYRIHGCGRLCALSKVAQVPGAEPQARPIAVGMIDRRFWAKQVMAVKAGAFAKYLGPRQVAVGVQAGAERLVHGMRMVLEKYPEFCRWSMDCANAFNGFVRSLVGYGLANANDELRELLPYVCALMGPEAPLAAGLQVDALQAVQDEFEKCLRSAEAEREAGLGGRVHGQGPEGRSQERERYADRVERLVRQGHGVTAIGALAEQVTAVEVGRVGQTSGHGGEGEDAGAGAGAVGAGVGADADALGAGAGAAADAVGTGEGAGVGAPGVGVGAGTSAVGAGVDAADGAPGVRAGVGVGAVGAGARARASAAAADVGADAGAGAGAGAVGAGAGSAESGSDADSGGEDGDLASEVAWKVFRHFDGWAAFSSSEGGAQGCPLMPALYCLVLHEFLVWFEGRVQAECKSRGMQGWEEVAIGAQMDDAGILAPPVAIAAVVPEFAEKLENEAGAALQVTKCGYEAAAAETRAQVPAGSKVAVGGKLNGMPIGPDAWVQAQVLECVEESIKIMGVRERQPGCQGWEGRTACSRSRPGSCSGRRPSVMGALTGAG
jgi:hypothetical protein